MPKTIWWAIFDTSIKHIFEVCAEILFLYNQPKTEMKDAKEILDACYKSNNVQKEFYIDNSELFELEKKAKRESEKRDEPKEVREYPRRREGRRSPRYSRDRNEYRGRRGIFLHKTKFI